MSMEQRRLLGIIHVISSREHSVLCHGISLYSTMNAFILGEKYRRHYVKMCPQTASRELLYYIHVHQQSLHHDVHGALLLKVLHV